MSALYNKAKVEKQAKEVETGLNLKGASKSLLRFVARCKAIEQLYPNDVALATKEMVEKNYRTAAPPSKSWIDLLKENGLENFAKTLEELFAKPATPAATPPAPAPTNGAAVAAPVPAPAPVAVPVSAPPPVTPSPAASTLDELLKPAGA